MRVVVGLGNPGDPYAATRHNVGFRIIERVAHALGAEAFVPGVQALVATAHPAAGPVLLVKPQTYMNGSGEAVGALLDGLEEELPLAHLLIVADDVHLPLGRLRFRARGSCGGHNGLASVEQALASEAYPRLRVGIGPAQEGAAAGESVAAEGAAEEQEEDLVSFVLGSFTEEEEEVLATVWPCAVHAVQDWLTQGLRYCQNHYNGWRPDSEVAEPETEPPRPSRAAAGDSETEAATADS